MNYWLLSLTFIAVNLDFFLIMLFLLRRYRVWDVAVGYTLGVVLLMSASYFIGQALALFFAGMGIRNFGDFANLYGGS